MNIVKFTMTHLVMPPLDMVGMVAKFADTIHVQGAPVRVQ